MVQLGTPFFPFPSIEMIMICYADTLSLILALAPQPNLSAQSRHGCVSGLDMLSVLDGYAMSAENLQNHGVGHVLMFNLKAADNKETPT